MYLGKRAFFLYLNFSFVSSAVTVLPVDEVKVDVGHVGLEDIPLVERQKGAGKTD